MLQVAGSLGAGYIWKDFMDAILAGQPDEPFPEPPGLVWTGACAEAKHADLFMDGPPGECGEPLKAPAEWKVNVPAAPARRGR